MQKQAPTLGRLAAMVVFALSCFGLLLFLWLSFGGATPLKPKGYRVEAAFAEATQLGVEADVRVAGVTVGKVREKRRDDVDRNRTIATLELDPRYAPVPRDARAILRQKTLLGETYVELALGDADGPALPEGGRLADRRVQDTVELDEILDTFDPYTRQALRTWQRSAGDAIDRRGGDVNDALGTLPGFVEDGGDLLGVLDRQRAALRGLVRNTGVVFQALTKREGQLQSLIRNGDTVFSAIQRQREDWAQTFKVLPTFLDESRATFRRMDRFAQDTDPLLVDLEPAVRDLGPTLESVGDLAPDLRRLFQRMSPLITASRRSLPDTTEVLDGLRPFLGELGPWLGQLNPILDWVGVHEHTLTDMLSHLGVATAARTQSSVKGAPGHYLRQIGPIGTETIAMWPRRLPTNRGNAYPNPLAFLGDEYTDNGSEAWDCKNASSNCREAKPFSFDGRLDKLPKVQARPYTTGG
ncbi:MlaD family protein [Conexibacter sp. SYSU D00693]|uniref:MlaD family protein n=1 Tax=Conexibacter sp. SYSU D00693 TaxID=2812560 RepID=UPI00196A4EC4|nr:MlaD family protein [Conexibacter sp. SYSU D00693]